MGMLSCDLWTARIGRETRIATPIWAVSLGLTALLSLAPLTPAAAASPSTLTCDDSLKSQFRPDALTTVVAVAAFKKGQPLVLGSDQGQSPATGRGGQSSVATGDICMVKLVVGPGNPGPAGAVSTSPGIGIEIWLPSAGAWNKRVHALGGGGWGGGAQGSPTVIASRNAAAIAGTEGAVTATTDTGHPIDATGAFGTKPDGSINGQLWQDFANRSLHELAVKTKALAAGFYGEPVKYAYWQGGSTGGRQGLNLAQNHPEDFDGIIALFPAINWSRFTTGELYPQLVMQRDLGGKPLTIVQLDLASNAAISACDLAGGKHLGFILDPAACTYDPTRDPAVLCSSDGGQRTGPDCITKVQAAAINKIWYGMTRNGEAPSPSVDNGWAAANRPALPSGSQRWFGLPRGALLGGRDGPRVNGLVSPLGAFVVASDMVALELGRPTLADDTFLNATGNGKSLWKGLSYAELSEAQERGAAMQSQFGGIDTDNPDLSAFAQRGGKMLTWHGLSDELIPPEGTINYYRRVADRMGGFAKVQDFYRLYLMPGLGHGTPNGTANPSASPPNFGQNQVYELITNWVEKKAPPGELTLNSPGGVAKALPACLYPKMVKYVQGDPANSQSYACR